MIASLAGAGTVNLGTNDLRTGNNTNTEFSGAIIGSGGLQKIGSGTFTLTGNNTYTGGTSANDGNLIGNVITSGGVTTGSFPPTGNININTSLTFNQTAEGTFSGNLIGAGSLTLTGNGALTLIGNNTYTGPTTINGGTLNAILPTTTTLIMNGGSYNLDTNQTVQSLSGSGGTVNLGNKILTTGENNNSTTFAGMIQDGGIGGSLVKEGKGTLTLTGNSTTFTGGTTINGGTLIGQITTANGVTTGSLPPFGNITNNGTLTFDQGGEGTFFGDITGDGSLTLTGNGVLTLIGNNTYKEFTIINGGYFKEFFLHRRLF